MNTRLKPIREQVIVITGASSGIGLATAKAAAEEGARLVLAARDEDSLKRIVAELKTHGADAMHVMADVGQRAQVQAIADRAFERFGGFDTWVNDAGVSIYGRLEEVSDEDHHRLFDTNFWGVVYGSQVAVKHLRANGGALINLGSVASDMSLPLQGMYCASKHAIKGYTDALRLELEEQHAPVSVTLIKPTSIATPFAQHAKNYMDREPTLPPPLYKPEDVAQAILYAASHPVRDIYVGGAGKVMTTLNKNFPSMMDKVSSRMMTAMQMRDETAHARDDSLAHADHDGSGKAIIRIGIRAAACTRPFRDIPSWPARWWPPRAQRQRRCCAAVNIARLCKGGMRDFARKRAPATAMERSQGWSLVMLQQSTVSLDDARRMIAAGEAKAREIGQPMNIAVVDNGGNLVAFEHMDGAWKGSVDIAMDKAFTSAMFVLPTKGLAEKAQPGEPFYGIQVSNQGRVMIFPGGIPLKQDGQCLGAIGVSGGDNAQDQAEATVAAL